MRIFKLTIRTAEDGRIIRVTHFKNKVTADLEKSNIIKNLESVLQCNYNTLFHLELDEIQINEN